MRNINLTKVSWKESNTVILGFLKSFLIFCWTFDIHPCIQVQIESRPQRKRPLRVVDDSNTGSAKWKSFPFLDNAIFLLIICSNIFSWSLLYCYKIIGLENTRKLSIWWNFSLQSECYFLDAGILTIFSILILKHLWQKLVHKMLWAIYRSVIVHLWSIKKMMHLCLLAFLKHIIIIYLLFSMHSVVFVEVYDEILTQNG